MGQQQQRNTTHEALRACSMLVLTNAHIYGENIVRGPTRCRAPTPRQTIFDSCV